MSSKSITDSVISTISKGPLVILVLLGIGFWQASKMSPEQIEVIRELVQVFNNPVGLALFLLLMLFLLYALLLWPIGKFMSEVVKEFLDSFLENQRRHALMQEEHIQASKGMFHALTDIKDTCAISSGSIQSVIERMDKFYGGDV